MKVWSIAKEFVAKTLEGHEGDVTSLCDINAELIASASTDNTIRVI